MTPPDRPAADLDRSAVPAADLARLTGAKTVANVALRWIPLFLPTLERAFQATTAQLTTVLGVGELAGMSTVVVGRHLDRGRERAVMVISLVVIAASALVALVGNIAAFAVATFLLVLGVANLTVAGQAWIAHRVDYRWRARSIGFFETSWAIAMLVGAPLIALVINGFGWRAPFIAVAIASLATAAMVRLTVSPSGPPPRIATTPVVPSATLSAAHDGGITMAAWFVMVGSALTAMAGLSVFVISGSWLDNEFGVSTGGIGIVAIAFGATELTASLSVATFADRVGKLRSTLAGLATLVVGLMMMVAASELWLGIAGIVVFLLGFEFGFVTSLSLVSEAMPTARGATIAISNGVGTIARAIAAIGSGWLYSRYGVAGTGALSAAAAVLAAVCLLVSRRRATTRTV